jgi:hypothetical protein
MSTCPNCKTKMTCGCQKRTASNGAAVCSTCISQYETSLKLTPSNPLPGTATASFRPTTTILHQKK